MCLILFFHNIQVTCCTYISHTTGTTVLRYFNIISTWQNSTGNQHNLFPDYKTIRNKFEASQKSPSLSWHPRGRQDCFMVSNFYFQICCCFTATHQIVAKIVTYWILYHHQKKLDFTDTANECYHFYFPVLTLWQHILEQHTNIVSSS